MERLVKGQFKDKSKNIPFPNTPCSSTNISIKCPYYVHKIKNACITAIGNP